jgi:hypothetical protein
MQVEVSGNWVFVYSGNGGVGGSYTLLHMIRLDKVSSLQIDTNNRAINLFVEGQAAPIFLEWFEQALYFEHVVRLLVDWLAIPREYVYNLDRRYNGPSYWG